MDHYTGNRQADKKGIPFGSYRLIKRIARGGMAEVFLARQGGPGGFDRVVALKRILPHLVDSADFVQMFLHEAQLAARLSHANIVHIYDFGKVDEQYFIAMEYVDGCHAGALSQRAADHPLPPALVARIGADACAGLHFAHQLKGSDGRPLRVVHRDVSPPNLLVSFDGVVKLVDFGIAKAVTAVDATRPGVVKGKFSYMSPEQAGGEALDGRSDVFSLGLVLFELLSGRPAVDRDRPMEAMRRIRQGEVPRIEQACPDVPPALAQAFGQALAVDPEDRATALELGTALEEFIKQSPGLGTSLELAAWIRHHGPERDDHGGLLATFAGAAHTAGGTSQGTSQGTSHGTSQGTTQGTSAGERFPGAGRPPLPGVAPTASATASEADAAPAAARVDPPADTSHDTSEGGFAPDYTQITTTDADQTDADQGDLRLPPDRPGGAPSAPPFPTPAAARPPPPGNDTIPMRLDPAAHGHELTDVARVSAPKRRKPWGAIVAVIAVACAGVLGAAGAMALLDDGSPDAEGADEEPEKQLAAAGGEAAAGADARAGPAVEPLERPSPPDAAPPPDALPPPDAAPPPASLTVITHPDGAEVSVEGHGESRTSPASFDDLAPGTHRLTLALDGHEGLTRELKLEPGENRSLELSLTELTSEPPPTAQRPRERRNRRAERAEAAPGRLVIRTRPYSDVYLGGRKLGTTPFANVTLPPGTYTLTFRNPDHPPHRRRVTVRSGEETRLNFQLP